MTSKYIKVPSLQGGNVSNGSLLDFDIPDYGTYNLANSYISLMVNANTTETATPVGIHAVNINQPNMMPLRNNMLIGDYDIRADKVGNIDNMQTSNVLNCNMDVFSRDFENMEADNYKQLTNYSDTTFLSANRLTSMFRVLQKDEPSREIPFEVKIPLNSFSSFCNTQTYQTANMGRTRVHAQLKTDQFTPQENVSYPSPYWSFECADIGAGDNHTLLTTKMYGLFMNLAQNDSVIVTRTVGGNNGNEIKTVNNIAKNGADNVATYTLTLNTALAAGDLTNLSVFKLIITTQNIGFAVCQDVPQGSTQNFVNLSNAVDYNLWKSYIGHPVRICSEGSTLLLFDTTIQDIDFMGVDGQGNPTLVSLYLTDAVSPPGADAQNVRIYVGVPAITPLKFDDVNPGTQGDNDEIPFPNNCSLDRLNLWVGKKVKVVCARGDNANPPAPQEIVATDCLVVSIDEDNDITFDRSFITLGQNETILQIGLQDVPAQSLNLTFTNPNLVLQQLNPGHRLLKNMPQSMVTVFPKFTVEKVNMPTGTVSFNRLFNVEPFVKNVFAIITSTTGLMSDGTNLVSYRWRVNNVDLTNIDINQDSGLEKDNMIQVLTNSSKPLKSLRKRYGNIKVCLPMCSLLVGEQKMLQITLNYSQALVSDKILYLFKESQSQIG